MEDGLSNRSLQVAREPGPSATREHAKLLTLLPCGEAKELPEERQTFFTNPARGLQNDRTEQMVRAPEASIVLTVLSKPVGVRGVLIPNAPRGKRTRDGHIHGKPLGIFPAGDGDVTGPTPRRIAQDKALLQYRRQQTLLGDSVHEVAQPVMAHDDVRIPLAASGVIAVHIKGLHAKGTTNTRARQLQTQAIPDCRAINLRGHDTARPIETRRDSRHPRPRVLGQQTCEALLLAI